MTLQEIFEKNLLKLRADRGLNVYRLSESQKLLASNLYCIVRGGRGTTLNSVDAICEVLKVDPVAMLTDWDEA